MDNVTANPGAGGSVFRAFSDGTAEWPGNIIAFVTGGSAGSWTIQYVDSTHGLPVNVLNSSIAITAASLPLPTGASTAANQSTGNTSLASIDGKITACNTGAVVVSSSALPSGAATAAKQPALGTAGTASTDVITVQGIASMTALKVDGSAVTQPVSDGGGSLTVDGTVAATQSGTWNVGTVTTITNVVHIDDNSSTISIDDGAGSITVDGTVAVSGSVAVTNAGLTTLAGAVYAEDTASANADPGVMILARRTGTPANTSGTDGDYEALQVSAGRLWVDASGKTLTVDGSGVTQPVSVASAVTVAQSTIGNLKATVTTIDSGGTDMTDTTNHALKVNVVAGGAGDGAILDGVSSSIKASVLDYTNSNPLAVRLSDTNGDYVAAGAGTQYTEDAAAASDPVGGMLMAVRRDTLSTSEVSADGDNIALKATNKGQLHVKLADTVTVDASGTTLTVNAHNVTNAGTFAVQAAQSGTWNVGTVTTITNVVHVDDNSGSLTVDNAGTFAVQAAQSGTWTVQPGNTANTTPWLANAKDPAATTGSISAADGTVASTTNAINQTVLTGTPDANSSVACSLTGHDTAVLQVSGNINLTLQFERSTDGGTTYTLLSMEEIGVAGAVATSLAINENKTTFLRANVAGMTNVRVRCTARTSGTASINWQPSWGLAHTNANLGQLAGTAIDTNSGNKSAGTLRVVLATDQPQLTNKLLVTPDANSAINVAQIGGNSVSAGNGASGTGVQRVTIANDSTGILAGVTTVTTVTTCSTVTTLTGGGVSHDGAASSVKPHLIGGFASAAAPTDVSADGDATQAWFLRNGAQVVQPTYAGVLQTTGNGASGTGVPRVTIANDSTGVVGLNAGTNLVGRVSASPETGTIYNGTTALTPKFAKITASSSGATTIVAAVTSKKLRVIKWDLVCNGAVNVKWQSHVTPTDLTGLYYFAANGGIQASECNSGHFETVSGEALDINLSGAVAVGGALTYVEV